MSHREGCSGGTLNSGCFHVVTFETSSNRQCVNGASYDTLFPVKQSARWLNFNWTMT